VILRIWSGCWFPGRGRETSTEWRPFMSLMPSLTAVAYCHALVKIFDSKVRVTIGLRKEGSQWLIAHEHHSCPIELNSGQ
jgi:SnoaL-like domain